MYELSHSGCPSCGWQPVLVEGFPAYAPALAHSGVGYHPEFFDVLESNEDKTYFWFEQRAALILESLRKYQPNLERWLEIGFGTGYLLNKVAHSYPNTAMYGSDVFIAGLKRSRNERAQLFQLDATDIPFEAAFDGVGAFDVLEHIKADERVISQVFQALRPGGVFLATVPQHQWLWSGADDNAHHVRRYGRRELATKMSAAGFEVLRDTSFMTLLLPLMLISRIRSKRNYDRRSEFQISSTLNWLFGRVFSLDRALIRLGLSLPVGGSRLVIGRKPVRPSR